MCTGSHRKNIAFDNHLSINYLSRWSLEVYRFQWFAAALDHHLLQTYGFFLIHFNPSATKAFSLHPFLSLSNLGSETIVTATYSWVNWDNKLRYSLCAMYCFLSQTLAVRNTPRLLYLQCPWNQRGTYRHHFISPDCYKLREGKHTSHL